MKKLLVLIAALAAAWMWSSGKVPGSRPPGAFGADGQPVVWIFTFSECGAPCARQLAELDQRQVPHTEKPVSPAEPESANYQLWEKMGRPNFPFVAAGHQRVTSDSRSELVGLLANVFGQRYLTAREARFMKDHFYADGKPRIVLYGTSWCGYCASLRKELKDASHDWLDIDVEADPRGPDMLQALEIGGYPAVWVGYTRVRGSRLADVLAVRG